MKSDIDIKRDVETQLRWDAFAAQQRQTLSPDMENWRQSALNAMREARNEDSGVAPSAPAREDSVLARAVEVALGSQDAKSVGDDSSVADDDAWASATTVGSALDASLSVSQRHRLLMVEAMAAFSAGPMGALIDQSHRLQDPNAMALLTSLPDVRGG